MHLKFISICRALKLKISFLIPTHTLLHVSYTYKSASPTLQTVPYENIVLHRFVRHSCVKKFKESSEST